MLLDALFSTRDLGRFVDIVGVLTRHGLGDLVQRMGWTDALERAGQSLRWEHAADLARLPRPVQLRMALEELGPTFVKLGQILAGRADLIGPDTIAELEKLHSRVPALPLAALRPQMREDLGDEPEAVFAHFEPEPLAAASIAQVHRARLHDGTEVVVKVRRPGISEVIDADLRLLERLAGIAEARMPSLKPYRPQGLVREFGRSLRRELDLAGECHNAERIAANLAPLGFVTIPQVVWAHNRSRINVQHFVGGVPGDHPGNVFYLPGNGIAFIDFGMVGRLSQRRRDELLQLLLGLVQRKPQQVADVLMDWASQQGAGLDHVNLALLETEIEDFVDQYHGTPLAQLNLAQMLADTTAILRSHQLALPSDLALLIKAFISLEGMGRGLDPGFHMATEALPLLRAVVRQRYQPKALALRGWGSLQRLLHVGEQLDRAASRLSVALVLAALIIGSSIVMTVGGGPQLFGLPAFGLMGFVGAVLGGGWLVRSTVRSRRRED